MNIGIEESDGESDSDEPDIAHMPAVLNPLTAIQNAELILRFPQKDSICYSVRMEYYVLVRNFIRSCSETY